MERSLCDYYFYRGGDLSWKYFTIFFYLCEQKTIQDDFLSLLDQLKINDHADGAEQHENDTVHDNLIRPGLGLSATDD